MIQHEHDRLIKIADLMVMECERATKLFGPFNSTHEGYAVILEELDELWELIKKNGNLEEMYKEAIQIGAMAIRFVAHI